MGVSVNTLKFLLLAHANGVSFRKVLMIGRQSLTVTANDLRALTELPISATLRRDLQRLELGPTVYAEQFFRLCGAETVQSMDKTDYEGATILHDMNLPIPSTLIGQYDLVVDGGSLEHVFNVPVALRNSMDMLKVDGHYVCATATNNYSGHGFYQFSPELFFAVFAPENGFRLLEAYLFEENGRNVWYRLSLSADSARRLTFQNSVPAHLLILAKKIADVPVFEHAPQQQMYQAAWEKPGEGSAVKAGLKGIAFRRLWQLSPRLFWFVLNTWNVRNRFRKDMFRRVN